jgi:hypothetical protein
MALHENPFSQSIENNRKSSASKYRISSVTDCSYSPGILQLRVEREGQNEMAGSAPVENLAEPGIKIVSLWRWMNCEVFLM